jgi:hypothetical protein
MFYFEPFPTIDYDIKKNGNKTEVTNLFLRYKVLDVFKNQSAVYYNYSIKDGERPDVIAAKYYNDESLDWIILLVNNIVDPQFDWPLDLKSFDSYITKKYDSVLAAREQTHHYEQITQQQQVLFDGTIVPEEYYEIDLTTYNTLSSSDKRIVTSYEYEERLNEAKRDIKLLSEEYVFDLVNQVKDVFK